MAGKKTWTLLPPPECQRACPAFPLNVTVRPGEALVLNTNIWYHGTRVVGKNLSIAIGSEYD